MQAIMNGQTNGSGHGEKSTASKRFADIPSTIDIPVSGGDVDEAVELGLEDLPDDPTELCTLLENENAAKNLWMTTSLAYAKQGKSDLAVDILTRGLQSLSRGLPKEKIGLLSLQCWLYLSKSRNSPRVISELQASSEARTKDYYLQAATGALNEASRVNPSFPPLYLARGVLSLLRASLQPPSKSSGPGTVEHSERIESLRQAGKCFDDAARVSAGRNMLAILGKSRTLLALGRYGEALEGYQEILSRVPDMIDPDPRIGIGCCLWQLSHVEEAKEAWERALELNPDSKVANILVGLYHIKGANKFDLNDPQFISQYKKAITVYVQKAFKLDKEYPLTCATFGGYFLPRQAWSMVENLARKAIENTDVNAIASDGWYLLARKEHYQEDPDWNKVVDYYNRADNARGGGDKGFLPAKFGAAQAQVRNLDIDGAKFRLEKIIQHPNSLEAKVLLGHTYAQEVFLNQSAAIKEDKSVEQKKAISYLEAVRLTWKDSKKASEPDMNLLITLSRLYEADQPDKSLQCLLQVQSLSLANLDEEFQYLEIEDEESRQEKAKAHLPPQLLNNIGCFQYQMEKHAEATSNFQIGLNACMNVEEGTVDSDQLVTTISYNLARAYEGSGLFDEAKTIYEGLLVRHPDYTDARTRLAYINLKQNPMGDGPKTVQSLFESEQRNMEVRALYGWYLSKSKKRTMNVAEDQEQRHYKQTLQQFDKHDQYSLTGMGNIHLTVAREMRKESEKDKERRVSAYLRSVEFYQKALQLDPKNAYAAQGIGIALAEDKKDFAGAMQIFSKIKDTIKDSSVLINLGHIHGELKQYGRAIESYEAALNKDRANDPQILACVGRIWLMRGKQEKSISSMKTSLDYSRRALEIAPEHVHFKFNVAFAQMQMAQLIYGLPDTQRTLEDVEFAADGLEQAIEAFDEIAQSKTPPYPRHDLEQRANMGRNTMRKQLERAMQSQKDYEGKNAAKLAEARKRREEDIAKKEAEKKRQEEEVAAQKRRLQEERQKHLDRSREIAEKRAEEARKQEEAEYTEDTDGERVKRKSKKKAAGKRKKKGEDDSDDDIIANSDEDGETRQPRKKFKKVDGDAPRKKRKLARKSEKVNSKYKSSEIVEDSDDSGDDMVPPAADNDDSDKLSDIPDSPGSPRQDQDTTMNDDDEDAEVVSAPRKKATRLIDDDDDDEDD